MRGFRLSNRRYRSHPPCRSLVCVRRSVSVTNATPAQNAHGCATDGFASPPNGWNTSSRSATGGSGRGRRVRPSTPAPEAFSMATSASWSSGTTSVSSRPSHSILCMPMSVVRASVIPVLPAVSRTRRRGACSRGYGSIPPSPWKSLDDRGGVKMVGGATFQPLPLQMCPPPPCHLMRVTLRSRKTIINPYSLNTRIIGGRGGCTGRNP